MLSNLSIKNFALIDQLDLELSQGLTILTGETGAGKSIILGALGLLQGKRADLSVVRDSSLKCVVEAQFDISKLILQERFESFDLDYEDLTIVRREILPSGKSRAFINDTPVRLSVLQAIGMELIDIHSQHQTLQIADATFQRNVLDAFVTDTTKSNKITFIEKMQAYKSQLTIYNKNQKQLASLEQQKLDLLKELDYNSFLLDELETVPLDQLDEEALKVELDQLSNVETIEQAYGELATVLSDDDAGMIDRLRAQKNNISGLVKYGTSYQSVLERVESLIIELEDVAQEAEQILSLTTSDPERIEFLSNQFNSLNTLFKKHQVQTVPELMSIRDELAMKVLDSQSVDSKIKKLSQLCAAQRESLQQLGNDIHALRSSHKAALEQEILKTTHLLGMPDAALSISITTSDHFYDHGMDEVRFLFSANKGSEVLELGKAASGGELSRLMLAIKALLSRVKKLPTIIFDEIDTGVSGRIADKMAVVMKDMSNELQVLTITHLPQIAAAGNDHLRVEKSNVNEKTVSTINRLSKKDRVEELAQMLSGGEITDAARSNARSLLGG